MNSFIYLFIYLFFVAAS